MLLSVELICIIRYFATDRNDPVSLRLALVALFLIDALPLLLAWWRCGKRAPFVFPHRSALLTRWHAQVPRRSRLGRLLRYPLYRKIVGNYSVSVAQTYLLSRVYRLMNSRLIGGGLLACVLAALGSGPTMAPINMTNISSLAAAVRMELWLGTAAATDIIISATLVVVLWRARQEASHFKQSTLTAPLNRLMIRTVESGSVTSAYALAALAVYLHDTQSTVRRAHSNRCSRVQGLTFQTQRSRRLVLASSPLWVGCIL